MQSLVTAFFQLKIKRKQRFQVRQQFQHFEYDMNRTLMKFAKESHHKLILSIKTID